MRVLGIRLHKLWYVPQSKHNVKITGLVFPQKRVLVRIRFSYEQFFERLFDRLDRGEAAAFLAGNV